MSEIKDNQQQPSPNILPYMKEYVEFMQNYSTKEPVSAEEVGAVVVRLANYFANQNIYRAEVEIELNKKAAAVYQSTEGDKPISAAKAKIIVDALPESHDVMKAKMHIENIEQYINALKCLQKGVLNEYSHMNA